jgi:hypothetical protein
MLRNYLPFYEISREIKQLSHTANIFKGTGSTHKITEAEAEEYSKLLTKIQKACEEHGLAHTAEMAKRAAQREVTTYDELYYSLTHLNDSLTTELEREAIFRIAPERKSYYEQNDLFGSEVAAAFPACAWDIRNAGNCYALEQADGCVHHLMMVLERGLRALAGKLSVPYLRTNWQDIDQQDRA